MELIVDPIIYQIQSSGGISRIFNEILPRMCDIDEGLKITLLKSGTFLMELPNHPQIRHQTIFPLEKIILRPGRLWWRAIPRVRARMSKRWIGSGRGKIWHSTYYTYLDPWEGRSVVTVADLIYERFKDQFSRTMDDRFREQKKKSILSADAVICISNTTRDDVQDYYHISPSKLHVVHLAQSPTFRPISESNRKVPPSTEKPFYLYVGMRAYYKNFDGFVKVFSDWPMRKEVDLVVVGVAWSEAEKRLLADLGIENQVHLLQGVDDETLCLLYNQSQALIYPSKYEGFGIPLLEAMACGCPIIASSIPSTREVAGDYPIYFELDSKGGLIAALDTALAEGRHSLRTIQGMKFVHDYSWDRTAEQTLAVYRSMEGS